MASERIFTERHLPGGSSITTNPSNSPEENKSLDELIKDIERRFSESHGLVAGRVSGNFRVSSSATKKRIYIPYQNFDYLVKPREKDTAQSRNPKPAMPTEDDKTGLPSHTESMNDMTRDELNSTLSAIEERMDKRVERIEKETDRRSEEFRKEISLRDDTIRRELDLRRESFLAEQAIRDQAWEAKFSGFLSTQAERDKRLDESVSGIRADLTRLGSLKLNIWGAMLTAVGVGLAVAALSVSFYQTGKADKPAAEIVQPSPPSAAKSGK